MTAHNKASFGEIAKRVLLPGDPSRSTFVATNFLEDAVKVTDFRGMLGYTGTYKNKRVSVLSSGMGSPSAGIYAYELYKYYEVDSIIRIGTCGGFKEEQEVGDLIIALTASTDSNWAHQYDLKGTYSPPCTFSLLENSIKVCRSLKIPFHVGMVFSSDLFSTYSALGEQSWQKWAAMGSLAQDMETYALYSTAAYLHKKALSILTITDNCLNGKSLSDDKRMSSMAPMIEVALETVVQQG